MTNREKKRMEILKKLKDLFTKNIVIKIVAIIFAMLLWGYVLTDQKPVRTKTISEVSTSFDGEAELLAQGLCVRGDRSEILKKVSVSVRAQITNYAYLSNKSISASISLKNISEPREYELPVTAAVSSSLGVVQQVTPSMVKVEIDSLRTKTIPVTTSFTGEMPDGYWADMDALTATARLDISGAKTDIAKVARAECVVDLTGRTTTIYSTFDVILYDLDDKEISSDIVVGTLPSSTVRLPIYPVRNVPIDVIGSLVGADNLAANHELVSAVATPATVRIVGSQTLIDAVKSILLAPIPVNNLGATATVESEIIVPEGVRLLDIEPVSVLIEIRETVVKQTFEQMPLVVTGLQPRCTAKIMPESIDVTIEGRISLASLIKRSDVMVSVDVTGLEPGTYTLQPFLFVRDENTTVELTITMSVPSVTVTITGS
ncbi:MAG: hypothetical protein RRZ24_07235 [Clostridia bacterium]